MQSSDAIRIFLLDLFEADSWTKRASEREREREREREER
jgi:hypothetical protein